jgi:hypothetical protein
MTQKCNHKVYYSKPHKTFQGGYFCDICGDEVKITDWETSFYLEFPSIGTMEIDSPIFVECTDEIIDFIKQLLEKTVKAYGNCELCYGKGYSTRAYNEVGSPDFAGDKGYEKEKLNEIQFCSCDRGKQLKKIFKNKDKEHIEKLGLIKDILNRESLCDSDARFKAYEEISK